MLHSVCGPAIVRNWSSTSQVCGCNSRRVHHIDTRIYIVYYHGVEPDQFTLFIEQAWEQKTLFHGSFFVSMIILMYTSLYLEANMTL